MPSRTGHRLELVYFADLRRFTTSVTSLIVSSKCKRMALRAAFGFRAAMAR
jgi:hypothetical protein